MRQFRDLCIISLLYESGARVSELINVKTAELRQQPPYTVILHGKGNKTRIIPLDKSLAKMLAKYIQRNGLSGNDYLFFNSRNEHLTREGVNYILQTYFKRAKTLRPDLFPKTISPHILRHSRAMHLLENGVSYARRECWIYSCRGLLQSARTVSFLQKRFHPRTSDARFSGIFLLPDDY